VPTWGSGTGTWPSDKLVLNDRQWQILGYRPGEIELTSVVWQSLLHPEDRPALDTAFKTHLRQGSPAYKLEHRLRHKAGHWVWVLDHAMVIERNAAGRAVRVLGTHLDITARKHAEEIQRDTAQRLELAMQSGNIGLLDWHLSSGTLILNTLGHAMLGRHVANPENAPIDAAEWEALRHPDDAAAVREIQAALVAGERQTADAEYRMRHADGHYICVHMRAEIVARDALDRPLRLVGIFRDISERKHTEEALAAAMALQRRTGELARVGGWEHDLAEGTSVWTDEVYRIYELPIGRPLALAQSIASYSREGRARLEAALQQASRHGTPWDMELQMTTALGRQIWVRSRCEVVSEGGKPRRLVGTIQDTTERMAVQMELQRANAQLAELSMTDGLTGVANRRHFDQAIAGEWPRSVRQQLPLALLMIDIDHFKAYNDAMGHQGGDACLRDVAHVLARCAWRPGELLARYGGEEFCILLPDSTLADARVVAQRCLDRLQQARIAHPASPTSQWLTISIGVASLVPRVGTLADALVELADGALYQAKRAGRARYVCAEEAEASAVTTLDADPPAL
jgi:diguanylate cyclase (GGDEF)-like protein/PAS domain S-box-containing protein